MALGVIKIIPASSHVEFSMSGGGTSGGGNPYPSCTVLNPNDGVAYVAQNRDCIGIGYGSWDWKVPSQSYALLPGPFQSLGIFYLDQSGAGRQGEITVYPSQRQFDVPMFNSIGRALQAQTTSLDVTEGVTPPNPGSGILRLWADGTDFLHLLNGAGTDAVVLDSLSTNVLRTSMAQLGTFAKRQLSYNGSGGDLQTGAALAASVYTQLMNPASANFNVDDANSVVLFLARVGVTLVNGAANNLFHIELNIDTGLALPTIGTSGIGPNGFYNMFAGGVYSMAGLAVGVHNIGIRFENNVAVTNFFCRPNSQPLYEPVQLDVIEIKRMN